MMLRDLSQVQHENKCERQETNSNTLTPNAHFLRYQGHQTTILSFIPPAHARDSLLDCGTQGRHIQFGNTFLSVSEQDCFLTVLH